MRSELDAVLGESVDVEAMQLVADVVLFDGGAFDAFVEQWAAFLPPDERDLADSWHDAHLDLFRVDAVRPHEGLTLRHVPAGDPRTVLDRTVGENIRPGDTVCARLLPVGHEWHNYGGLHPVGADRNAAVLDLVTAPTPSPAELVRTLRGA
ncbi:hypothetical protein [Rhodococcus chondri]|uniref:Uncharacterized protein n=1 Tax=Rhodococcus chondri TaxID=3065941 RepID=A0ABU7JQ65_9NOCA|nr:hypothetical protein [Rhodococcus sp. CC-R104]MEE2031960.1 hypothetical protein [Rhodococcus sp. CC-R104]